MSNITLKGLRDNIHHRVLHLRSMESTINGILFERLYNESDKEKKEDVIKILESSTKDKLIVWINRHPALDVGEKSVSQLRDTASKLRIKNYSRLLKHEVVAAIKDKEKPHEKGRHDSGDSTNARDNGLGDVGSRN